MKIVDVNPFFYPSDGWIERRMHDTSRLLAAKGHDVTILTARLPDTPEEEMTEYGYRVVRLRSRIINLQNPVISSKDIFENILGLDPDVVNYNYRWSQSYNRDMKRYDGKKVFTYHNSWGEGLEGRTKRTESDDNKFSSCLDTFDHIIAVSDFIRNDLIKRGYPPGYVTSIPTGLSEYPQKGKGDGDFILSLGRLVKSKGLDHLILAMKDVDCKLIICGKGPEYDHLVDLIKKLDLEDRIEMKGWVDEDEKERLIGSCKFFVMPSLFEPFSLAAIEILAHARPIVYTDVNGLPNTIKDGGLSVPPADPAALSKAMNLLLDDPHYTEQLGKNAVKQSLVYKWENLIPKIENVYEKVLSDQYSVRDLQDHS